MIKKSSLLFLASVIMSIFGVFLSCRLSKDPKNPAENAKNISLDDENPVQEFSSFNEQKHNKNSASIKNDETRNFPRSETSLETKPITQFDSKSLDDKVREQARRFGVDEKTYRLPVREDPDNTKIYRMLGMHVIVNPNGEEVFIPDEL